MHSLAHWSFKLYSSPVSPTLGGLHEECTPAAKANEVSRSEASSTWGVATGAASGRDEGEGRLDQASKQRLRVHIPVSATESHGCVQRFVEDAFVYYRRLALERAREMAA